MKKELVVLSLVVAVFVAAGFGESDNEFDNKNETTTHSHTSSEPPTSTKSSATSSRPLTSAATAITGHGETTAFPSPTTPKPLGVYAVKDSKGSYCIIIDANISIAVNYVSAANKTESCNVYVPPANNVTIAGSCGEHKANEQWIAIHFNGDWNLTFRFERLNSKYFLSNLSLEWNLDTSCAKHPEHGQLEINTHLFETSTGYLCMARKSLYTNASVVNDIGGIYTEKLKLEAFQNKTSPSFSDKLERCSEDNISNLVPIIVGACLGGLIIIVLIAYLIGRKRSRRGYESV